MTLPTRTGTTQLTEINTKIIQDIGHNFELCQQLCASLLIDGVDFGQTPGTKGKGLWDPGAAKLIRGFGCHAEHKIIFQEDNEEVTTFIVETSLLKSGECVGTGLGVASTRESKYKYRWVKDPENYGYAAEEIKELKTRAGYNPGEVLYRIVNPEYGDLINTLLAMSAKRSEVDAVKSLPGVGTALRLFLDPESQAKAAPASDYKRFWNIIKLSGMTEDNAHKGLGVASLKEWEAQGKSLDEAIALLMKKLVEVAVAKKEPKARKETPAPATAPTPAPAPEAERHGNYMPPETISEVMLVTPEDLEFYCQFYWKMPPQEVYAQLGYADRMAFLKGGEKPYQGFATIRKLKTEKPPEQLL